MGWEEKRMRPFLSIDSGSAVLRVIGHKFYDPRGHGNLHLGARPAIADVLRGGGHPQRPQRRWGKTAWTCLPLLPNNKPLRWTKRPSTKRLTQIRTNGSFLPSLPKSIKDKKALQYTSNFGKQIVRIKA